MRALSALVGAPRPDLIANKRPGPGAVKPREPPANAGAPRILSNDRRCLTATGRRSYPAPTPFTSPTEGAEAPFLLTNVTLCAASDGHGSRWDEVDLRVQMSVAADHAGPVPDQADLVAGQARRGLQTQPATVELTDGYRQLQPGSRGADL